MKKYFIKYNLSLPKTELDLLDSVSAKLHTSRSETVRKAIRYAYKEYNSREGVIHD